MTSENAVWLVVGLLAWPAIMLGRWIARRAKDLKDKLPGDM